MKDISVVATFGLFLTFLYMFACGLIFSFYIYIYIYTLSLFSHVQLCATPWTMVHQAPLSMEFSRQNYWSGLPCPSPGDLPNPGIELTSLTSPALAGRFFTTSTTWEVYQRGKGWGRDKLGVGG